MSLKTKIEQLLGETYAVHVETNIDVLGDKFTKVTTTTIEGGYEVIVLLNNAVSQSEDEKANIVFDRTITSGVAEE